MADAEPVESPESDSGTKVGNRIFFVIAWAMSTAIVFNTALTFSSSSAAYEWMNRLGVFMFFALTLAFLGWALPSTTRHRWSGTRASAWLGRAFVLIGISLIIFTIWDRILEALWLR